MTATDLATSLGTAALAYGLGSLNAAFHLLRWHDGRDIRQLGSGNAGARNAGRVLGGSGFALVFAFDAGKGALAVLFARAWAPEMAPACAVIAAFGHVFPVQLGWRGGKGVATAVGGIAVLELRVLALIAALYAAAAALRWRSAPAGIAAFAGGALLALAMAPTAIGLAVLALTALLAFTHRHDLRAGSGS